MSILRCPKCSSPSLIKHGWQWQLEKASPTGKVRMVQRYRCKSCGRFTISPKETK